MLTTFEMVYSNQLGYSLNQVGLNHLDFPLNFLNEKEKFQGWQGHFCWYAQREFDLEYYNYIKKF